MRTVFAQLLVGCLTVAAVAGDSGTAANSTSSSRSSALDPVYYVKDLFITQIYRYIDIGSIVEVSESDKIEPWPAIQAILAAVAPISACVIVGILFCIIMPIMGLCCCCCRLCNNCGGKVPDMDPPKAKCKRVTCGFLLLVLTTLTLFGAVETFLSINELNRQLQQSDGSAISEVNPLLASMFDQVKAAADQPAQSLPQLRSEIVQSLNESGAVVFQNLIGVSPDIAISMQKLLNDSESNIAKLSYLLGFIQSTQRSVSQLQPTWASCCSNSCAVIPNNNYTQFNVSRLQQPLADATAALQQASTVYDRLKSAISEGTSTARTSATAVIAELQNSLQNFSQSLAIDDAKSTVKLNETTSAAISAYSKYALYGGFGLGSVVALVVLLLYLALCCGLCGRRAGEDSSSCCSKGSGASLLVAATAFMFIFSWIIMLVTLSLFPMSAMHLPCWLVDGVLSTKMDDSGELSKIEIPSLGNALPTYTVNDISTAFSNCKNNSLYSVIERLVPQVRDSLANVTNRNTWATGALTNLSITLPSGVNETVANFTSLNGSLWNLVSIVMEVQELARQPPFTPALDSLAANLSDNCSSIAPANLSLLANDTADALTQLGLLTQAVRQVLLDAANLTEQARSGIVNLASGAVAGRIPLAPHLTDIIINGLERAANDTIDRLTKIPCNNLYDSVKAVTDLVCSDLLDPMDAFWFSLGWSVVCFVPLIIVSLYLVSLYRRQEPFKSQKNRFEDEGYGEDDGVTIRDSVPLDNMPSSRKSAQYHQDAAYANAAYLGPQGDSRASVPPPYYGMYTGGGSGAHNAANFPRVVPSPTNNDVTYGGPPAAMSISQKRY